MSRSEYEIKSISINDTLITKVVIDDHYKEKHAESITDELILCLVKQLNNRYELPDSTDGDYTYFATVLSLESKQYRLIWLLEENEIYIGIINAFRDSKGE
jgi:hypothetical protein